MKEQGEASYGAEKAVTRIYLGSRVSQADEALVRATSQEIGVPVSKMEIDKYAMSFKSLPNIRLRLRPKS